MKKLSNFQKRLKKIKKNIWRSVGVAPAHEALIPKHYAVEELHTVQGKVGLYFIPMILSFSQVILEADQRMMWSAPAIVFGLLFFTNLANIFMVKPEKEGWGYKIYKAKHDMYMAIFYDGPVTEDISVAEVKQESEAFLKQILVFKEHPDFENPKYMAIVLALSQVPDGIRAG